MWKRPLTFLGWTMYALCTLGSLAVLGFSVWVLARGLLSAPPTAIVITGFGVAVAAWIGLKVAHRLKKQQNDYLNRRRTPGQQPPRSD